jgi:flagellar biosynthesis regulator FlaF
MGFAKANLCRLGIKPLFMLNSDSYSSFIFVSFSLRLWFQRKADKKDSCPINLLCDELKITFISLVLFLLRPEAQGKKNQKENAERIFRSLRRATRLTQP